MTDTLQQSPSRLPAACIQISLPNHYGSLWALLASGQYDSSMSDRKARITVTIDPHLAAYAEQLVATGKAESVSAVVNDALSDRKEKDRRIARRWKEITAQADPAKVTRMMAHIEAQGAQLPETHR